MKKLLKWVGITVALLLSTLISVVLLGQQAFNHQVRKKLEGLLKRSERTSEKVITEDMLRDLPKPVQRYLQYSGVVGKPFATTAFVRQQGKMHPSPEGPWIPLDFETYYSVQPPGFVWHGTMHLGPLPLAQACDSYLEGSGHMLVKAASLVTVVDSRGERMDLGAMMRYLNEMTLFPSAFLGDNIAFQPIDEYSARVTLTDHGRSVSATLCFDEAGKLVGFEANQYRTVANGLELTPWSTPIRTYGEYAGLKLPFTGTAVWHLQGGDYAYIDSTVTEVKYDVHQPENRDRHAHMPSSVGMSGWKWATEHLPVKHPVVGIS
jgi:hypothetical protein